MKTLDREQWLAALAARPEGGQSKTKAMASTWWNGIVTDPSLMVVPIEDHQVHRGDAVFEAMKFRGERVYLRDEHLDRLWTSAGLIGLDPPVERAKLEEMIASTIEASGLEAGLLRIFFSRGVGGFSVNPYDCPRGECHVVVTEGVMVPESRVTQGASVGWSRWPAKEPWFAQIKSCNYLLNVMMKKEAVDRGLDYVVALDSRGFVTESSTENILLLSAEGVLLRPRANAVLKGTTMTRACELARQELGLRMEERDLLPEEFVRAKEVFMAGTTIDVLPVTRIEGVSIGQGSAGECAMKLRKLIQDEI